MAQENGKRRSRAQSRAESRTESRAELRTERVAPRGNELDELYRTVLAVESLGEARRFFADLCTPKELEALRDRWRVARLIDRGLSYREIRESTGVSTATITRVGRALAYGSGGYRLQLDREKAKRARKKDRR